MADSVGSKRSLDVESSGETVIEAKRPRAESPPNSDTAAPPLPAATDLAPKADIKIQPTQAPVAPTTSTIPDTDLSQTINGSSTVKPSDPAPVSRLGLKPVLPELPPSLELITGVKTDLRARDGLVGEEHVGIMGYAGEGAFGGIRGVIKQRFTDFMVYEVGLDGQILHLKDIGKPVDPYFDQPKDKGKGKGKEVASAESNDTADNAGLVEGDAKEEATANDVDDLPEKLRFEPHPQWSTSTTRSLRPHLSDETILQLHALLVEGKDPPPRTDSGWGMRKAKVDGEKSAEEAAMNLDGDAGGSGSTSGIGAVGGGWDSWSSRGGRGRGRGGRGGRGGGRGGDDGKWWAGREDWREVLSQPMESKEARTATHKAVREALNGLFETTSRDIPGEVGQRIVIKWSNKQSRRDDRQGQHQARPPQYIHFTLHKTNRDTQDCLGHLSRALGVNIKDLSVCGTKDKRAVTVQRVCLRRGGRNLVSVWRSVNGVKPGKRTEKEAVTERGDRGTRIGDLEYSGKYLELGMLKGNHFVIALRNVQAESQDEIDRILTSLKTRGFINFYGMQRFGTSTVPTHVTGLYILQKKWTEAVDSILSLRDSEHPDCVRGRLAWLEDQDLDKALQVMPRRCVAERSIWEFWKRGGRKEDKVGALGCIPRNLRTMYVHAYQSYIWNLVVSERIKLSSSKPLAGDLVFVGISNDEEVPDASNRGKGRSSWETSSSQEVKQLTEDDLPNHTIFDVVMPLPGWNVDYPGGDIGAMYERILRADGLDPHRMRREQREYSLPGSYRRIIHLPTNLTWQHISYTDPDVALVQADEDAILNLNPPAPVSSSATGSDGESSGEGKFKALRLELTLGASAYATMALREITREETSTWWQAGLTAKGEDQGYKGSKREGEGEDGVDEEEGAGDAEAVGLAES